jgi:hypothetical protein
MIETSSPSDSIKPSKTFPREQVEAIRIEEKKAYRDELWRQLDRTNRNIQNMKHKIYNN